MGLTSDHPPPAGATSVAIRQGRAGEQRAIATLLATAFLVDPIASYLFPERAPRRAQLERFFSLQLRYSYLPRGEIWVAESPATGRLVGAGLWLPPSALAPRLAVAFWPMLLIGVFGSRFLLAHRLGRLLAAHHPRAPHWYLGTIGIAAERRGVGIGSALLAPVLARCDAERLPVYLECSSEANLAFYRRLGFTVTEEIAAPDGPPLWLMWRAPQHEAA